MGVIDLRSDFLSHDSPAMKAAARDAADSRHFGLREDPWQRKVEARIAEMLGQEDALVFPTCTMANTVALLLQAKPGETVVTQHAAHVLVSEANAGAALGGLWMTSVDTEGALPPLSSWDRAFGNGSDAQRSRVALAVLENTHMRAGGAALPVEYAHDVVTLVRKRGGALHLDGSRIFYAACALATTPARLASGFDTVSVSLNKTFGAPIGAALAASATHIERALVLRQRLGGGLRPMGPAAAATVAGLDDLSHIATCNALAARLASALANLPCIVPEAPAHPTNIVAAKVLTPWTAAMLCDALAAAGILALPMGVNHIRFVTYRGITADHVEHVIACLGDLLRNRAR
ncbi:MAG: hypothetical protein IT522_10145 [Burkholderiales bacterium]|nr:hypothetical protein [Burkholderiales bacterium]